MFLLGVKKSYNLKKKSWFFALKMAKSAIKKTQKNQNPLWAAIIRICSQHPQSSSDVIGEILKMLCGFV
jgi:hypothetical protein